MTWITLLWIPFLIYLPLPVDKTAQECCNYIFRMLQQQISLLVITSLRSIKENTQRLLFVCCLDQQLFPAVHMFNKDPRVKRKNVMFMETKRKKKVHVWIWDGRLISSHFWWKKVFIWSSFWQNIVRDFLFCFVTHHIITSGCCDKLSWSCVSCIVFNKQKSCCWRVMRALCVVKWLMMLAETRFFHRRK